MKYNIQLAIIFVLIWFFISVGCSSVLTAQYINTFGKLTETEGNYVTVNLRRSTGFFHFQIYVMEYASDDNYTGVLGVQYPLFIGSRGAKLWTNENGTGQIFDNIKVTLPNGQDERNLSGSVAIHPELAKALDTFWLASASYDDILSLFKKGENYYIYHVKNVYRVKSVAFHKVAVIGTVANKDILIWKRPPGNFRIALLFTKGVGNFFQSDIINAAPGESIYIDLRLPFIANDARRGWSTNEIFKNVSRTPF